MKRVWLALSVSLVPGFTGQAPVLTSDVYRARAPREGELMLFQKTTRDLAFLEVGIVRLAAGDSAHFERSHEDLEEIIIVTEGRVRVAIDSGPTGVIGPGGVAVILPKDTHRLENAGPSPATFRQFLYRSRAPADPERGRRAGGSFLTDQEELELKKSPTGARRDYFDRPTTMLERLEMHASTLNEALTNHPPHTHRAEEMVLIVHGDVRMRMAETRRNASTGDLVFLASQVFHSLDNIGLGPAEYFAWQWR